MGVDVSSGVTGAACGGSWYGEGSGSWQGSFDDTNIINLNREINSRVESLNYSMVELKSSVSDLNASMEEISSFLNDLSEYLESFSSVYIDSSSSSSST